MKHASKGIHLGFETQGRRHQKSKTGLSVTPQKEMCPSKIKTRMHSSKMHTVRCSGTESQTGVKHYLSATTVADGKK